MESKEFIVDYAYGFHTKTCDVDYVSSLRTKAALRALKKYPNAHIVLGAGMKASTGDCGPIADMMKNFLVQHGVVSEKIYKNPEGDDTLSETEAMYRVIQKHGGGKIICATSVFHAPRVWLIWFFRFGIFPELYTTKLKPRFSEYGRELIKIPRDILRSLFRRTESRNK